MTREQAGCVPAAGRDAGPELPVRLSLVLLAFGVGVLGAAAAVALTERRDWAVLVWGLTAVVIAVSLLRPRRVEHAIAAAGAAALFTAIVAGMQHGTAGVWPRSLVLPAGIGALILLVAPLAPLLVVRELHRALAQSRMLAGGNAPAAGVTGAYQSRYLAHFLREEVERGRRGQRSFTVCLVAFDGWQEMVDRLGAGEANRRLQSALGDLAASQRALDRVIDLGDGEAVLVLPETPLGGAETVAWRIQSTIAADVPVTVRVGIAEFPRDAGDEDGLLEEARQAMQFARTANIPVVDRSLLGAD